MAVSTIPGNSDKGNNEEGIIMIKIILLIIIFIVSFFSFGLMINSNGKNDTFYSMIWLSTILAHIFCIIWILED